MSFAPNFFDYIAFIGIFSVVVATIFLFQYRKLRISLMLREKEMTQRMYQLSILRELGERIGYSLKIEKIVEVIAGSLRRVMDYSTVAYMLASPPDEGKPHLNFNINLERPVNKNFVEEVKKKTLQSLNALVGHEYKTEDIEETISGTITDPTSTAEVASFFNIPIVIGGKPVGVLNISDVVAGRYKGKEVEILYTIMSQASDAVSKLEHVLKVEKGKLDSTVASMADGVVMIDTNKQLYVINEAAKKMLGLDGNKVSIFEVLDATANQFDLRTKLEESINQDKLVVIPTVTLGSFFLQVLITPVKDENKSPLGSVVLFRDITKEKAVEKMRDDFTNMMVHELRSPLTGIKSIAGLLSNEQIKKDTKKYTEFINLVSSNAQDMLSLVNDLLDVAKLEAGKFQILKKQSNLRQIIDTRVNSFKPLAEQNNLKMTSKIADSVPVEMSFDEHKIAQALNNFISNAIKFTAAGGSIVVAAFKLLANKDLAQEVVEQSLIWPGIKRGVSYKSDRVVIGVTDSGVGIPADKMSELFNKYVQLENAARSEKKGTGLGLVITKGIIEAHGGTLGVCSEEGEGSTFYFMLPIDDTASSAAVVGTAKISN